MLRAIVTDVSIDVVRRRFAVGVAGIAPSGVQVYRPTFLKGAWCKSVARSKARRLQRELGQGLHGHLLGWHK